MRKQLTIDSQSSKKFHRMGLCQANFGRLLPTLHSRSTSVTFESDDSSTMRPKTLSLSVQKRALGDQLFPKDSRAQLEHLALEELIILEEKMRKNNESVKKPSILNPEQLADLISSIHLGKVGIKAQFSFLKTGSTDIRKSGKASFVPKTKLKTLKKRKPLENLENNSKVLMNQKETLDEGVLRENNCIPDQEIIDHITFLKLSIQETETLKSSLGNDLSRLREMKSLMNQHISYGFDIKHVSEYMRPRKCNELSQETCIRRAVQRSHMKPNETLLFKYDQKRKRIAKYIEVLKRLIQALRSGSKSTSHQLETQLEWLSRNLRLDSKLFSSIQASWHRISYFLQNERT
jgi:hypothetical protein